MRIRNESPTWQEVCLPFSNSKEKETLMKIIKNTGFKQAATTTTKYESPEPEETVTQSPDLPQHRSSGEEHPEHGQLQEARLNRARRSRNWREAAMADLPVVLLSHLVRFRTKRSA